MLPRIIFAALFFCALASRPDAQTGRRRPPVAATTVSAAAGPELRAAAPTPTR